MKRFFLWSMAALALFVLSFLGLNLFDTAPAPEAPAVPLALELEPGNGFLLLWGFAEPPQSDPLSSPYRAQLRELFAGRPRSPLLRSPYSQWLARLNDGFRRYWHSTAFHFPQQAGEDVCAYVASRSTEIRERQVRLAVPLRRYRRILRAADLADFTPPGWELPGRCSLLANQAARLFAASQALAATEGQWLPAIGELLAAMDAGFRLVGCGRSMAVNSLGKTMVELSLRTLASLLDRGDCPPEAARLAADRLPERPAAAFGTAAAREFALRSFALALERIKSDRAVDPFLLKDAFRNPAGLFALERFVAISVPRFYTAAHALAAFFVKENETLAMMRAFWQRIGVLEEVPPWKWGKEPPGPPRSPAVASGPVWRGANGPVWRGTNGPVWRGTDGPVWRGTDGPFWWLRNPLGKMMVRSAVPYAWPILQHYVYRSHELRARYELTRLLARARLRAGPGMTLSREALRELLDAARERDPFSGKPYLFNPDSGMLYSVGQDGLDNKGREQPASWRDSDIAVPIGFVIRDS
jgi:hypothetical protein